MSVNDLALGLVSGVMAAGGIGVPLPPSNLVFLYDPAYGVYSDAAMTVAIADGEAIRGLADRSPNGHDLTQTGASTLCPTYRASVSQFNGKPAFEFDGGDYLIRNLTASILGNLSTYTVYMVFRSGASATRYLWCEGSSSAVRWMGNDINEGGAGRGRFYHVDDAGDYPTTILINSNNNIDNTALVWATRRSGTTFEARGNYYREIIGTKTISTATYDRLLLGAREQSGTIDSYFNGQIALIAAYSADNFFTIWPILRDYFAICDTYRDGIAKTFFMIGDSKAWGVSDRVRSRCGGFGLPPILADSLTTADSQTWREVLPRAYHDGFTVATTAGVIAADLAATSGLAPDAVLIQLGTNDLASLPAEATWKANMTTILSAINTKWPSATIYLCKPVRLAAAPPSAPVAGTATLHTWIDDLIALHAYVSEGWDETNLEGGDSYATNFADALHPTKAGYTASAAEVQTAMGF